MSSMILVNGLLGGLLVVDFTMYPHELHHVRAYLERIHYLYSSSRSDVSIKVFRSLLSFQLLVYNVECRFKKDIPVSVLMKPFNLAYCVTFTHFSLAGDMCNEFTPLELKSGYLSGAIEPPCKDKSTIHN